jgi:hypothetical protein
MPLRPTAIWLISGHPDRRQESSARWTWPHAMLTLIRARVQSNTTRQLRLPTSLLRQQVPRYVWLRRPRPLVAAAKLCCGTFADPWHTAGVS